MSGQAAFDKPVRSAALCRDGAAEKEVEQCEETELNGVGEESDDMSDDEGDKIDDEEELAAPDWRVRARPRNKLRQREKKQHTCRSETGAHTAWWEGVAPIITFAKQKVKVSPEGPSSQLVISS